MAVAGARTLSALLAGRSKKQKYEPKNRQRLQEEALRMLSSHQNLGDLLLEVGSSLCEKPSCSSGLGTGSCEASVPELFLVSALQDRASALGLPVGILSARTAANHIEKISAGSGDAVLLDAEQRKTLSCLLQSLKDLLARSAFCCSLFAEEMWKLQSPLVLEVAWHLHRESIVSLEELLEKHPDDVPVLVERLCRSLCLLCHRAEDPSLDTEPLGRMLTDFVTFFLLNGFQKASEQKKQKLAFQKTSKICCAVLERMLAWALDAAAKEKQDDASTLKAVKCWLHVFSVTAQHGTVPLASLQQFFGHTLTQVLTYNPQLKVSDAIQLQREWSFARTSSLLPMLYRNLFVVFKAEELIRHLQQVLETSEVNWQHILSCISTLLVCRSEAEPLVKELLGQLLRKAFENYDLEHMIAAFLIVRQAALEGPAIFMPYSEWFKAAFGSPSSAFQGGSKKSLVFLFKFLSELVPFEAPQYLKVHIMHPPFVPSKYRPLLLEYITLAKTRLADFKVAIEDMGLYEDLSSLKETVQPHGQALQDVEKALQIFENTGKIPASVMEASIFRRSYYTSRFVPALLVPRVLPETPDSRMALIDSLKRAEKIPLNTYSAYLEGCRALKEKLLQDGSAEMDIVGLQEPLELLKAELEALRGLITDQSRHDAVPAQMAVISEKLTGLLGHTSAEDEAASLSLRIELSLSDPRVDPRDQRAVDLLLTSFCQNVAAASYFSPPDRQGPWPSLFAKMVCGHRQLLPSLFSRLCQLLSHQGSSLSEAQVLGLAVFVVHLNEARSLIPEVDVCSGVPRSASGRGLSVPELWSYFFPCSTGDSMVFCMRFCTAAVSYGLCRFSSLPPDCLCALLHPGFLKKLQYVVLRLAVEARGIGCEGEEEGAAGQPWRSFSRPSLGCRTAALCLWKQRRFRELLQEEACQLSLQEWLLLELGVGPDEDVLSSPERQEFHYWALYQHYLPAPAEAGGCGGDLREACAILLGTVLDFCQRSQWDNCSLLKSSIPSGRGSPDIHCRLQEMLLELVLVRRRAPPEPHFLFGVFQKRLLRVLGDGSTVSERLLRQQELVFQTGILLGLPPAVLFATRQRGEKLTLDCQDFFSFVNIELGLLSTSLECDEAAQEVTAILALCQDKCPILLASAARWWRRLEPVLCSEWRRLFGAPLAEGLQSFRELQSSVRSFLSSEAASLLSDVPWISAAFLHFFAQQQRATEDLEEALQRLGPGAEQLLLCLLFFSIVDFISARAAPQEGVDAHRALDRGSKVLRRLDQRGVSWLPVFSSPGTGQIHPCPALLCAVSDHHLRLLPVAFYSLLFASDPEQLLIREQTAFLSVAVAMYTQLLQLFVDGGAVAPGLLGQREQSLPASQPEDLLALIKKSREFLLSAIPRCPGRSVPSLQQQFLELCGELDPEITAALTTCAADGDLLAEEDLLLF